ncbi:hypothetical protein Tco_1278428 [Tanacetum coccineum]
MEDEHLDTIPETKSNELIKSSVEDLVHTPSESDGVFEGECDLPVCDDSSSKKDEVLDDIISIPPRNGNDHFNAESSPIESVLNRNNVISSPKIDLFIEEFAGELAHIISPSEEPRVHVPNILPTHLTLHLDSDFTISSDSLGSDLVVSFPSGTRNKIFDPRIFIRVQSKIFLSRDAFSISFIRDPLFPMIDTLVLFSSENEDKVVNTGILAAGEEQSPHLSSH